MNDILFYEKINAQPEKQSIIEGKVEQRNRPDKTITILAKAFGLSSTIDHMARICTVD
jgi:hypothetical protein